MIYLGNQAVGVANDKAILDHLHTLTFVNALGTDGRQTVTPDQTWGRYDYLLFVPDLVVTAQEGETRGNWLWFSVNRGATSRSQYEGSSTLGLRDKAFTLVISKGYKPESNDYEWVYQWITGRGNSLPLADQTDIDSETFADLTYTYGPYYGGTYAIMNGTVKVYGGILPK